MRSLSRPVLRALLLPLFLTAACAGPVERPVEQPVSLATAGGDAWTFEKSVAGQVVPAACDRVRLIAAHGAQTIRPQPDGRFEAQVPLAAGDNRIAAECRRAGQARGQPAVQHWQVRLPDRPRAMAQMQLAGGRLMLDAGASAPAASRDGAPITAYDWRARSGDPARLPGLPAQGKTLTLALPEADGEYYVTLRVTDTRGRSDESTVMLRRRGGVPEVFDPLRQHAGWVDRAVLYGAVPFFFGPRGFDDITARLDELAALGVTAILLPPVTAAPPNDYGYAVTDYFSLNPRYGSEADWRELIAAARARGLRVVMDLVPNHLSDQHPYFTDAAARQRASPYYAFFARDAAGAALHYFDWQNLKNLNLDHPEVQNLLIEAAAWWVRHYDIDGFRLDVAWGPRQRNPGFWPRWAAELTRIKPDLLLLAEASARDAYYGRHGFDAAYDWTDQLGQWAWRDAFEDEAATAEKLRHALKATPAAIPVFRFLNNNDTGARFIARYGLPRTRVATAMLLTLPGLPALFTGDEVGASFLPYDDTAPVRWAEDPHNLRLWHAHLIRLRDGHPALRDGPLQLVEVEPAASVLAYLRPSAAGGSILVLLNYAAEPLEVSLPSEALQHLAAAQSRGRVVDLLNGAAVRLQSGNRIALPGYGVRILRAL